MATAGTPGGEDGATALPNEPIDDGGSTGAVDPGTGDDGTVSYDEEPTVLVENDTEVVSVDRSEQASILDVPINADKVIEKIRAALAAGIPEITAYGRAWKAYSKADGKTVVQYPEAYSGKGEYVSLLPQDTLKGYCFFYGKDKAEPIDYAPNIPNEWKQPIDIVFWYNMKALYPQADQVVTENMIARVRRVLSNLSQVTVLAVFTEPSNIFSGFTISEVDSQFIRYPYGGFRIATSIQYLETYLYNQCQTP